MHCESHIVGKNTSEEKWILGDAPKTETHKFTPQILRGVFFCLFVCFPSNASAGETVNFTLQLRCSGAAQRFLRMFDIWVTIHSCLLPVCPGFQVAKALRLKRYGVWTQRTLTTSSMFVLQLNYTALPRFVFLNASIPLQASSWADFSLQMAARWGACRVHRPRFKAWPPLLC